jgi:peptidoglycan/LPS O-acetylase OafA/YrhL
VDRSFSRFIGFLCYYPAVDRRNNFDLLRILAALQVAIIHGVLHLNIEPNALTSVIQIFPGVPIFFVISGYLVSASFERSDLRAYFIKRALRIYPGLWACLAVSMASVYLISGIDFTALWVLAQLTIVQFYNPDYLREYGVGVLNGSLWTIPVELQFYLCLPVLYWLLRSNKSLLVAIILGVIANQVFVWFAWRSDALLVKLANVSLAPFLYMFLIGVILQRNTGVVRKLLAGKLHIWIAIYLAQSGLLWSLGFNVGGNLINPVSETILAMLVVSAAYSRPIHLPADLSYGLYLYHMPVANAMLELGYSSLLTMLAISIGLAWLSWVIVERPALATRNILLPRTHKVMTG